MAKRISLLDILVLHLPLLLCFLMIYAVAASPRMSKPSCSDRCGNMTIPFPFGMDRSECFLDEWYEVDCQNESIPFLKKLNLQLLGISLPTYGNASDEYVTVRFPIIYSNSCYLGPKVINQPPSLQGSPFIFSFAKNMLAAAGCSVTAQMDTNYSFVGCKVGCSGGNFHRYSTCSGFDSCCQATVPASLQTFKDVEFINLDKNATDPSHCNYAFLASRSMLFRSSFTDLDSLKMEGYAPVELYWTIAKNSDLGNLLYDPTSNYPHASHRCERYSLRHGNTTWIYCYCQFGYDGNAYLVDGCQDINECEDGRNRCPGGCLNTPGSFHCVDPRKTLKSILVGIGSGLGMLLLFLLGWRLCRIIKKGKEKKLKEKYFKRNGGLILQQQLLSSKGNVQKGKLFNQKEIQVATENFNESRVLGKGGQGTVYKGMLTDGRIVAIKKALFIDEVKVEQFINEVMILTEISHRNIVQLLGCCLETEIPLLVYEFIPNGNLYEYLHGSNKEDPVSWEVRLQLAIEIAEAIFYLHSAASRPVYHRDIKSTNILLDEKYRAKIADFGTSRSVSLDQTHVTTLVKGTIGYLDPEFFQTNQFTDKSDVYSFGVILVELLTRQKPICIERMEEGINLAAFFILAIEDGHLFDIIDLELLSQGIEEEILGVATLARSCLNSYGRNRPTMREVAMELDRIKKLGHLPNFQESEENCTQVQCQGIFKSASARLKVNTSVTASLDVQPLLHGIT